LIATEAEEPIAGMESTDDTRDRKLEWLHLERAKENEPESGNMPRTGSEVHLESMS
jgi:hypothetical protein